MHREQQEKIRAEEPGKYGGGLEVHLRAIAPPSAGALEVFIHASAKLADEAVAAAELKSGGGRRFAGVAGESNGANCFGLHAGESSLVARRPDFRTSYG